MKIAIILIPALLTFVIYATPIKLNSETEKKPRTNIIKIKDNYEIGREKRGCKGLGYSCLFEIDLFPYLIQNNPQYAEATLSDSKNLSFTFYVPANEFESEFLVEDVSKNLFQKHAKAFECSFLELIPGIYKTSKLSDGRINVVLKVNSR